MNNLNKTLSDILPDKAKYLIGYADLQGLLPDKYLDFDYGIVLARRLDYDIISSIENGPNIEYYNHYKSVNKELAEVAHFVCEYLRQCDAQAMVIKPTIQDEDLDNNFTKTLRLDFSHKMAATRAGLGWIGKTALFISKEYGPRVRLVTVLTDYPLPVCTRPIEESQCGTCDLCVRICPAQAANGITWNINIDRNDFFDPFACLKKARELSLKNFGKEAGICGKCIVVCPIGKSRKPASR
ncbi:MAG: epoxyqueuosine reductase [Syntrophaceae bacterium]|nr:epoxyqueuosine reductase [Syntrophaceae bacterium]